MANITLKTGKIVWFPEVCMRCGAPTLLAFASRLECWRWFLQIEIPLCRQHEKHLKQRSYCLAIGLPSAFVPIGIFLFRLIAADPGKPFQLSWNVDGALLFTGFSILLGTLLIVLGLHLSGIRVAKLDRDTFTLAGVCDQFVQAFIAREAQARLSIDPNLAAAVTASPTSLRSSTPAVPSRDLTEWASAQGPLAEDATWVLDEAQLVALSFSHDHVGTEHLLFALRTIVPTTTAFALKSLAIDPEQIEQVIKGGASKPTARKELNPPATPQLRRAILGAFAEARARQCPVLRASHLLVGLLNEEECTAAQILLQLGHDLDHVRQTIIEPEAGIIAHREAIREA